MLGQMQRQGRPAVSTLTKLIRAVRKSQVCEGLAKCVKDWGELVGLRAPCRSSQPPALEWGWGLQLWGWGWGWGTRQQCKGQELL